MYYWQTQIMNTCARFECNAKSELKCNLVGCDFGICSIVMDQTHPNHLSHVIEWARHCKLIHGVTINIHTTHAHVGGKRDHAEVSHEPTTAKDKQNYTNMFIAIRDHNTAALNQLGDVVIRSMINMHSPAGETALRFACFTGDIAFVRSILGYGAEINGTTQMFNRTALHAACENNLEDIAYFLLNNKANVTSVDRDGNNALHLASKMGYENIVVLLCTHKLTQSHLDEILNATNCDTMTPGDLAIASRQQAIAHRIEQYKNTLPIIMEDDSSPPQTMDESVRPTLQSSIKYISPIPLDGFGMEAEHQEPKLHYLSKIK